MATFTIKSTSDSNSDAGIGTEIGSTGNYQGTLREAINFANQNVGTSNVTQILVSPGLSGTIKLDGNLPLVASSIQLDGGNLRLDGGGVYRGFLISGIASNGTGPAATTVGISNLTIQNVLAKGGLGGDGGGGGLGAGGAIFVGPEADVSLTNVGISQASAQGGGAGYLAGHYSKSYPVGLGGGGGLGGNGGYSTARPPGASQNSYAGGGGGILFGGADQYGGGGGISGPATKYTGGAGINGVGGGGNSYSELSHKTGKPGMFGGGGGAGYRAAAGGFGGGGGGGIVMGGAGGFGGGGGGGISDSHGGDGGFGAGGGAGAHGGTGGFSAGGGSYFFASSGPASGGSGGGGASVIGGDGGNGASLGGAIFVASGGQLTINGSSYESGSSVQAAVSTVPPGTEGNNGGGYAATHGAGIFFQATDGAPTTLNFGSGKQNYSDEITDYIGSGGTNPNAGASANDTGGSVTVVKNGLGTLTLSSANTYTGGTTISAGTLVAAHSDGTSNNYIDALGNGSITLTGGTLANGASSTVTLTNSIRVGTNGGALDDGGEEVNLTGPVTGTGDLTLAGSSGSFLVAQDMHTGATILSGTVSVFGTQAGAFSAASAFEVGKGTLLGLGDNQTIASLADGSGGGGTVNSGFGSATLTLAGSANTSFSGTITDGGFLSVAPLTLVRSGTGTQTLSGANTFSGGTTIDAGMLDLDVADVMSGTTVTSGGAGTGAITFAGTGDHPAMLALEGVAQPTPGMLLAPGPAFANTLASFNSASDSLDLKGFTFDPLDVAYAPVGNTLTILGGTGGTQSETFTLSNGALAYTAQSDGAGGTLITALCFAQGTLIATSRGDVAVEALRVGDFVVTASGTSRRIRWLGHRDTDCREHPNQRPIRVAAHAFSADIPTRDLYLSPGHLVLVGAEADNEGGHLVPIMCLINGTTIERVEVDEIPYWHVELDQHDILLAENLPAESYIDLGSRPWFKGADGPLYDPDMAAPGMPARCRPVAIDGPVVEAERRRLDAVFAMRLASASAWPGAEDGLAL